jgi:hypothetical protein
VDKLFTMALAVPISSPVPIFYDEVQYYVSLITMVVFLAVEGWALVHCLTQRADAFPVVGSLSKGGWLAILAGAVLVTLLCGNPNFGGVSMFSFIAVGAALIYLLDVRPALRDATDGSGSW